ncbi:MAG: flagellar biosynthetic protein FliO [Oricola sp.]
MHDWLVATFGEQGALYATYGGGAIGILVLIWVLWFWTRRVSGGVFVHGGRGRKPRLAVVDAAAVDSHRRIVLVRRDDVEHLVMIGGHNDFVIERGIGAEIAAPAQEPAQQPKEPQEPPAGRLQKPLREAPGTERREPAAVEKPVERKAPPPPPLAVEPKPEPAPRPAAQAEHLTPTPQPVTAPEPPQKELPGDYADVQQEQPARRVAEPAPIQVAAIPPAYAEHAGIDVAEAKREPAFNIEPRNTPEEAATGFEDQVRASIARAEPAATPKADEGSLEDEMQKLLAELTRKK